MCSRTKWISCMICLVRLWWTGFEDIYIAKMLSYYATVALSRWQCN
jgi:hypothetical protein